MAVYCRAFNPDFDTNVFWFLVMQRVSLNIQRILCALPGIATHGNSNYLYRVIVAILQLFKPIAIL